MTENFYNTETYNRTGHYKRDPRLFSGIISDYDFNGYNSMVRIASSIKSDQKFNKFCQMGGTHYKYNFTRKKDN